MIPSSEYRLRRSGRPIASNRTLRRPVSGDPSSDHANPATSGGMNSGITPAIAMTPLKGVLVRVTIQAKNRPTTIAIAAPLSAVSSELKTAPRTAALVRMSR